MTQFAPTPQHGAAYAIAIETIGGIEAVANCHTPETYNESRTKLDALLAWARTQDSGIFAAYSWGIDKVDGDLQSRLKIYENNRLVTAALAVLPRPPNG